MLSHLDKESGSLQVRKDTQSFNVCLKDNEIIFESKPAFVPFIHAAMYEACVDMHHALEQLKQLNDPAEIQKNMLDHAVNNIQNKQERTLLEKAINTGSILMELEATTKEGVIREMVDLLDHQGLLVDKELCCQDIFERESVISTCMQNGVAMPHGRTDGTKQLVAAIGIHKSGFDFDSLDGKPTKIFVLCLSPKNSTGPHIQFISSIASVLNKQEAVDSILNAKTPTQILSILSNKKQK